MSTHFKGAGTILISLFLSLPFGSLSAQTPVVSLNTVLLSPPYTVPLDELQDKVRITVLSNTSMEGVYITMTIAGDNGVQIQSNLNQISRFYIEAGLPLIIPSPDIDFNSLFQRSNLNITGVNASTLYDYGLPPGNYQFCFRLWRTVSGAPVPLSPDLPAGCANLSIPAPSINIITIVKPPWDADFLQYYNKTMVTVSSNQSAQLYLHMKLKGDNGIEISTAPGYRPSTFLNLDAGVPLMLTESDLYDLFEPDLMIFSGIGYDELAAKGLPAGTYRLCFTAYTSIGELASAPDPSGCSGLFTLLLLEPPTIISPHCGEKFSGTSGKPLIFSWTPSPGAPPLTPYTIRIVEMLDPSVPPGDALQTATTPAFLEETVLGTSFLYGPEQSPLEEGKKYAFQVIAGTEALNIDNPFDFNAGMLRFKNQGKSAPCYFVYEDGMPETEIETVPVFKPSGPKVSAIPPDINILPFTIVRGQLNYKFKYSPADGMGIPNLAGGSSGQNPTGTSIGAGISPVSQTTAGSNNTGISQVGATSAQNMQTSVQQSQINFSSESLGYINPANSKPLANVSVSLVVQYVLISGYIGPNQAPGTVLTREMVSGAVYDYDSSFPDNGKVLQTVNTSSDGSFSFLFPTLDTTIGKTRNIEKPQSTQVDITSSGKVLKTVRLMVNNNYYCSPDVNFFIRPWEENDYGILVSYVKSYNLQVKVKSWDALMWGYDQGMGSGSPLNDVEVAVLRANLLPGVPYDEGESGNKIPPLAGTKKQIASGNTGLNGDVIIPQLVMHDLNNNADHYWIKCKTSKTSGNINYREVEMAYFKAYKNSEGDFPYNTSYVPESNDPGIPAFNTPAIGCAATYNSEFEVRTYELSISMVPELPRVYGQAFITGMKDMVNKGNTMTDTTKSDLKVELWSVYTKAQNVPANEGVLGTVTSKSTYTDSNGHYSFEDLPLELDKSGVVAGEPETYQAKVVGPKRNIIVKSGGFGYINRDIGIPKYGDQIKQDLMLYPDGVAMGYVVDEDGTPVPSSVKIDDCPAVKTGEFSLGTAMFLSNQKAIGRENIPSGSQVFVFLAPSTFNTGIRIIPNDLSMYEPFDTVTRVAQKDDSNPGTVTKYVVKKRMHRARFKIVGEYNLPNGPAINAPVKGVRVKVSNIVENVEGITDNQGFITLQFMHSDVYFKLNIVPPEETDYGMKESYFLSIPTTEVKNHPQIMLQPSFKINGKVTIGENNENADSVKIYVDGSPEIFTYSSSDGTFLLRRIPREMKSCVIKAEKHDPKITIIGDVSDPVNLPSSAAVNLHLDIVPGMPTALYGFKIAISSHIIEGNSATISGSLADLSQLGNNSFQLQSPGQLQLDFANIKLIRKDQEFIPEESFIPLDAAKLDLIVNGSYMAEQTPPSGNFITISKSVSAGGQINGMVRLKNSFGFNSNLFTFHDDVWLKDPGASNNIINIFETGLQLNVLQTAQIKPSTIMQVSTSSGSSAPSATRLFSLIGSQSADIHVTLKGFDGLCKAGSYLRGDTLALSLTLSTNEMENINPSKITLNLPELKLTNAGMEPVEGKQELSFNLENWKVVSKDWKLSQQSSGFELSAATLKTGLVDLPVNKIEITPDNIHIWQVQLKEMTVAGVVPLTLETQNSSFGYFPSIGKDQKGHWRLAVVGLSGQPAVTISGLPGLKPGTKLAFGTFALLSNGEQSLDFIQTGEPYEFYNTLKVKPIAIYPYDGYFLLSGSMDLGIPRLAAQNGNIRFSKSGGAIKFDLMPLNMDFEGPGKVRFFASQTFGDQKFQNGNFMAPGNIVDAEGINLKSVLHRTLDDIWIEVNPANQILPIKSNNTARIIDVEGEMRVDKQKNDWNLFSFEGILEGLEGMEGDKKKKFTIYGDIVADNQDVKVKNIETGFGNLNMTFDFANGRMLGDMDINQSFGGMAIHAVANMAIDGGGWYFLAGGELDVPSMGGIQAGFMIGKYDNMPPEITGKLMQFAYDKNIPPSFSNHISGMFITGRWDVPMINIPDVNVDLGILSAKFGADVGLDARFWMGFESSGNEYGIGLMAFIHAYFTASSITCTDLSADARVELGAKGYYNTGTGDFTLEGCGSFGLGVSIEQCFPTLVAGCQGCIGYSLSKAIKANVMLNSSGQKEISLGLGNCSGAATMTSDW